MMRVVRPAHKIEPRFLNQLHIATASRLSHGNSPTRMILVRIDPAQIKMLAIEKKTAIARPFKPAKPDARLKHAPFNHVRRRFRPERCKDQDDQDATVSAG